MEMFDLAIIGAGPGGYVAAIRAGQLGLKTVIIEKGEKLGGTCLNVGCIPSKALLESSHHYQTATKHFEDFGIKAENIFCDTQKIIERKNKIVEELTGGISMLMKKNKVTVIKGVAKLTGKNSIEISGEENQTIEAKSILLASGSVPVEIPAFKFDGKYIVSSTEALAFPEVPDSLLVIGGGAIGLELGSVWSRLGSDVTIVEMLDHIVPPADKTIAQTLTRALKKQGLKIKVKTQVMKTEIQNNRVLVSLKNDKGKEETVECSKVLVAVGRRPYTENLGLEELGVLKDERGFVSIGENYRTSVDNIYAIGDLVKGPMLAHKAEEEGVYVAEIIAGKKSHIDITNIPSIVYTHPELAQAGLTQEAAESKGIDTKNGQFFYRANGRAKSMGEIDGIAMIVADKQTDKILGGHIVGANASEMIMEVVVALESGWTAEQLGKTIHGHPTLSEIVKEAALAVNNEAIHS